MSCVVCVRFIVAANDLFIYILIVYGCGKMRGRKRWRGDIFWNRLVMITESGGPVFMTNSGALLAPGAPGNTVTTCKTDKNGRGERET